MPEGHFRITNPTIALFMEDGRHVARTIPYGALVVVPNGKTFDGDKLIEVQWEGAHAPCPSNSLKEWTA
jgi:hypothetical protein